MGIIGNLPSSRSGNQHTQRISDSPIILDWSHQQQSTRLRLFVYKQTNINWHQKCWTFFTMHDESRSLLNWVWRTIAHTWVNPNSIDDLLWIHPSIAPKLFISLFKAQLVRPSRLPNYIGNRHLPYIHRIHRKFLFTHCRKRATYHLL